MLCTFKVQHAMHASNMLECSASECVGLNCLSFTADKTIVKNVNEIEGIHISLLPPKNVFENYMLLWTGSFTDT